jgi:ABC-type oligopeptide transport system substrate-binding subunit
VAVVDIASGLEPDLFSLLASSQVRASGSNLSGYQDPALDKLIDAARAPGTPEARIAAWKALLGAVDERMPILPLTWGDEVFLARGLEGPTPRLLASPGDRFGDVLAWRLAADR